MVMTDAAPPWAFERPEIRPYDPRLTEKAEAERVRLTGLLAPWLAIGVEHIGSTAVPGLAAKPIIDLMAAVRDPGTVVTEASDTLAANGWCYVPEDLDGRPWRSFYVKPDDSGRHRQAHLHLIRAGHPRWSEQLAFRDALREDPDLASRYADLKRQLSAEHPDDREGYTDAKAEFIAAVLSLRAKGGA
jgi:GrpB-like predicted nucleotidyltransferase (UPF0157 family)